MERQDVINAKKDILLFLSKRQIKEAIELLMKLVVNTNDWTFSESLNDIETNYKYLLHYYFEGVEDPERGKLYNNILRSLFELTDEASDELLKIDSPNIYYQKLRSVEFKQPLSVKEYSKQLQDLYESHSLIDLLDEGDEKEYKLRDLAIKRERIGSSLFDIVFASSRKKEQNLDDLRYFLNDIILPSREKCLVVSAITLKLFHQFDAAYVQILMDAIGIDNALVRNRAIVGLVVIMQMYDIRWHLYPELQNRLDILTEDIHFRKTVLQIIIQLIRSRETEKITKKIKEEILPEMMKFNSLNLKLKTDDLTNEVDITDKNPEWQKELDDSGLSKKLQEYSNMQMEGADILHSTFSSLKSYPFFSEMSNWFLPFETSYSEISSLFPQEKSKTLLNTAIANSPHMCDSDKYSLCLSLLQIPNSQRDMVMNQIGAESEDVKQLQEDMKNLNPLLDNEVVSNQYIQNLYRFFKISPYKTSFFDIFKLKLNFYDKQSIAPIISDTASMKKVADYCFEKNNFQEALVIYEKILKADIATEGTLQKIGYCKQMLNDLDGALSFYLNAELLNPDNPWIIKRIAAIYRSLKQPENALSYFKKAQKLNPDNINIEINIGHCYLEIKDLENALNTYFKVELLDSKGDKARRAIAWTAFLLKKFDLSQKYYKLILENQPTLHDFLNAGHVELCMGNRKEALTHYGRVVEIINNLQEFISLLETDKDNLIANGIQAEAFPFIYDQIKYKFD